MKSTVEPIEGNKVKVSVEVDEAEVDKQIDAAFRRIAREVRIDGFRPGKAPRRILEARVGTEAARAEALHHALPEYYSRAVLEHDVDVIAPPQIDITAGQEEGAVVFDAVVEVRPQITVGGYASIRITIARPEPSDEEVDARIDHLREQFGDLSPVERPAIDGDNVTIDINGSQNGEVMAGLTAQGYLYEVGSGVVVPEFDEQLRGSKPGDILQFTAAHPEPGQDPVDFRVLVKEVKEKMLPEPTDEWAAEASEFDTFDELRADTAKRLRLMKRVQAQMDLQEKTASALAELVTDDIPEALITAEMQSRVENLAMRLQAQGIGLEDYFEATGADQETFREELRSTSTQGVKVDLALRAVAEAESMETTDEDLDAEYAAVADRLGEKPASVRKRIESSDQVPLVRSEIKKRKALEWLLLQVEVVDEAGETIDRADLTVESEADEHEGEALPEEAGEAPQDTVEQPEEEA